MFNQCELALMDYSSDPEVRELQRQRRICGWDFSDATITIWRDLADKKLMSLFWILVPEAALNAAGKATGITHAPIGGATAPKVETYFDMVSLPALASDGDETQQSGEQPPAQRLARAGHIALCSISSDGDLEVANPDRSVMTIAVLFVLPELRSLGIARAAMDTLEGYATREPYGSPDCKALVVNALSRSYVEDDEMRKFMLEGLQTKDGLLENPHHPEKGRSNEDWYAKRGYIKWKEEPKYPVTLKDGTPHKLIASYLKKPLK
jgi:GNAT superfamily N-acetyltransferase